MTATTTEDDELRDLIDVLRQPLQGRSVLVPLGSQAFLEGTLDPLGSYHERTSASSANPAAGAAVEQQGDGGDGGSDEEERVMIKIHNHNGDGEDSERVLTRQQAKEYFEAERAALRHEATAKKAEALREELEAEDSPTSSQETTTPKPQSSAAKPLAGPSTPADDESDAFTAYFEIREELDEQGREVRAEAVDVSRQLAMLESDAAHGDDMSAEEWKRQPVHRPAVDHDFRGDTESTNDAVSTNNETHSSTDNPPKTILSDDEYDKLSARLDELAMLEEQAEHNKVVNTASRKGIQGGGWSKGFLNNSKTKKTKQVPPPKPPNRQHESSNTPSAPDVQPIRMEKANEEESRSRAVSFNPQGNDVREIPRVGFRSARELKNKPMPPSDQFGFDRNGRGAGSAVSSVVRERVKPSSKKGRDAARLGTGTASGSEPPPLPSTDEPPRRLSRFAQERLRQQQEQNQR